jgi:flagellar hook-associated protein 3 FlgL
MGEIAIRGASAGTPPAERATLGTELAALRRALIDHANARDSTGRPLFAGTRTGADPFVETAAGVVYRGDGARPQLRVSESARIDTGLSGAELFQSVPDATGARRDLFGLIDDLARSLGSADVAAAAERAEGAGALHLTPDLTRSAASWQMTVTGPAGSARVAADLVAGAPGPLIDAINAAAAQTGVTAAPGPDGGVTLQAAGAVAVSDLAVDPARGGVLARADGQPMIAAGRSAGALVAGLRAAADHVADARAEVGALGAVAERQGALIERRQTALAGVLAGIEDLDIAEAVTRLQELMLTRQVSQQTYARIAQASLFDWLR